MRIIGIMLMSLSMLVAFLFPQYTLRAYQNTSEIKIKFEVKNNLNKFSILYNFSGYEPIKQDRKFFINVSAYTAAADECGKSNGVTASGRRVKEKRTIACPKNYAFGTRIKIDGYGTYVCEDRGGTIKGNKFDIYMQTKSEAFAFGRRTLLAQVLE
jgi:3D (Asp-Asp-Asp) domain-containing protein